MFSICNGKQKFIYNYKALESLMIKSHKNNSGNYLGLNLSNYKPKKNIFNPLHFNNNFNNEEKISKFCKEKNEEMNIIKKRLFNKKIDILLNNAFDKSNNIRKYNSHKSLRKYHCFNLINKKCPEINNKSSSLNKSNTNLFKIKIKNVISTNFNNFFPEKYINSRERIITEIDKKLIKSKKNKNFDSHNKLFKMKYLKTSTNKEDNKDFNKQRHNKLLDKLMIIYNKTNNEKLININKDKPKSRKCLDLGLNTLPYL